MLASLSHRRSRPRPHIPGRYRALVPCLLALGCSLEVAGNGAERSMREAGAEPVEGSEPAILPDAGAPDARTPDAGESPRPQLDAAPPEDAGDARDAHVTDAHAPTDAAAPVGDAQPSGDASTPPVVSCDLEGRFALRIAFDVTWVGTEFLSIVPVIESGQGALSFIVLMDLASSATGFDATFRTCSSSVPEFAAAISRERYQAHIEDAVWDRDTMPLFSGRFETSCLEPGCGVGGEPLNALVGAALPGLDAPWPSQPGQGEWPDHDGDGAPGIATRMLGPSDGPYAFPPLDLLSVRRLRELALGLRVVVGFDGELDGCDVMRGTTSQGSIETRAVGCTASSAPFACTPDELEFLNNNLPVWNAGNGRFEARRLPATAQCGEARRLFARGRP